MSENKGNNKQKSLLEIKDLRVLFPVHKKWLPAVDGVSFGNYRSSRRIWFWQKCDVAVSSEVERP